MQEAAYCCSANGALISLHPYNLTAVNTEAHMSAREHYCVLVGSVAYHALFLAFIGEVGCIIINSIDVVEVHDLVVVEQLLSDILVPNVVWTISLKLPVCKLNVTFASASVSFRVDCFDGYYDWIEVLSNTE
jgi:hypothetical protein